MVVGPDEVGGLVLAGCLDGCLDEVLFVAELIVLF